MNKILVHSPDQALLLNPGHPAVIIKHLVSSHSKRMMQNAIHMGIFLITLMINN